MSTFFYSNKHIIYLACCNKNIPLYLCIGHFSLYLAPILPICVLQFFFFFLLLTFVHSSLFPALFARYFPSLFNLSLTFQIIFSLHVNYKVKKHIQGIRNDCPENRDICLEEHVIYLGDITHLYIRRTKRDL